MSDDSKAFGSVELGKSALDQLDDTLNWRTGLAPFASNAKQSRGRLIPEPESPTRTPFQRDRDRIIHSAAFRRLKHKTQVFVSHEGDHYRTRLTHSLEVSQIARSIARSLRLDEDLAEALALVHDFGHTPFGHAGERALEKQMEGQGGFEHNAQALRIVTELERRYIPFDGLNLSWEVLEGLIKHNGPLLGPNRVKDVPVPEPVLRYCEMWDLELHSFSSLEAQAAAISDDIAYNSADLDDGLRAGLFDIATISDVPLVGRLLKKIETRFGEVENSRLGAEIVRQLVTVLVEDAIFHSRELIRSIFPKSIEDVRNAEQTIICFSPVMEDELNGLRRFLWDNMYRHPKVMNVMKPAEDLVGKLFDTYLENPDEMSDDWIARWDMPTPDQRRRQVCDYIAGMTDDFALLEANRLFDHPVRLR
jgi:dGTPase